VSNYLQAKNNAGAVVAGIHNPGAPTIAVQSTAGLPATYPYLVTATRRRQVLALYGPNPTILLPAAKERFRISQ
jgi:hypothetical protein